MLRVKGTYVNKTAGHGIGSDPRFEEVDKTRGELYRSLQEEYGRCTGKMYRDVKGGGAVACGWVFEGKDRYSDTGETYIREAWIEVIEPAKARRRGTLPTVEDRDLMREAANRGLLT